MSVPWRIVPSTIAWTSEAEQFSSCEWITTEPFSTCQ